MADRFDRMRRNPAADWTIGDPAVPTILTVPFARPIKPVYIRKLVALIDAVERSR